MKKSSLFSILLLFLIGYVNAQHREVLQFESFDQVQLDGNIRLYIDQGHREVVTLEARKERYLDDYRIEVRNNTLYIRYREHGFGSAAKIKVYIEHPELKGIDADGLVHINSEDIISGESFAIKGDGLIKGTVEVDVQRLRVDLDGLCFMNFSGNADIADLDLDGVGRINASELETSEVDKSADGLASIKTNE